MKDRLHRPQADACKDYGSNHPVQRTRWKEKLFLIFLAGLALLNLWFILASGPN